MSGVTTLMIVGAVMLAVLALIPLLAYIYNLNHIKSKTVGDGQHGTARWATKAEIKKTYQHIPFTPSKWRKQAKDGKQHSRGIFVTTSRFTPDAKRILETMSDKIIGYDGKDLYEAAKECEFGVIKRGNEWILDEKLLSGPKAFFNMY